MKRIEYLDAIKGIAIILMVVGHAIAWNYGNFKDIVEYNFVQSVQVKVGGVIWQLIYSFHMALFFMVSGFLSYKESGVENVGSFLFKKTKRLLIPWAFTFGIIFLVRGSMGYWFLLSLFEMALVGYLYIMLQQIIHSQSLFVDALIGGAFYWGLHFLSGVSVLNVNLGIFSFYWLPFCFGILMHKYDWIYKLCCNNQLFFTVNLLIFAISFFSRYLQFSNVFVMINNLSNYYISISGSLVVWYVLANLKDGKLFKMFSFLGKKTMPIYILHILFVIQIPFVGHFILSQTPVTSITLQLTYSLLITAVAVFWSLTTYRVLKNSRILSALLFGEYETK